MLLRCLGGAPPIYPPLPRRALLLVALAASLLASCGGGGTIPQATATGAVPRATALQVEPLWTQPSGSGTVETLAWRPGQGQFASGSSDGQLRLWSRDGAPLQTAQFGGFISGLAWSVDGARLALATTDGTVAFWPDHGTWPDHVPSTPKRYGAVAWSPANGLAVAPGEGSVRLWSGSAAPPRTLALAGQSTEVTWSPDGGLLAAGNRTGTVEVWTAAGEQHWASEEPGRKDVNALAWSPDGQTLAAAYEDGSIHLFGVGSGKERATLDNGGSVNGLAWSPNGAVLAVSSLRLTVTLWSIAQQTALADLLVGYDVNDVAWSPEGDRVVAGADDHALHAWSVRPAQGPGPRSGPTTGYMAR